MKVCLIGGVNSSLATLKKMSEYEIDIVRVYGYKPSGKFEVSGYCDLEPHCQMNNIDFKPFLRINDHAEEICTLGVDFIFVVGLSQLICVDIIDSPKVACVGFHPTNLPKGRGRAPLAWLVNENVDGAASFFVIDAEADKGALLAQREFSVCENDLVKDVEAKMLSAIDGALSKLLPKLIKGEWNPIQQSELDATEFGVRKPEDGLINWHCTSNSVHRLIKAASFPHPGAFTYFGEETIKVKDSRKEQELSIKGVTGRVLKKLNSELLVQCDDFPIWITVDPESYELIKVGELLGYKLELEIYKLKSELASIRSALRKFQ